MCGPLPGCRAAAVSCSSGQSRGQHSSPQRCAAGGMSSRSVVLSAYSTVVGLSAPRPFPRQGAIYAFFFIIDVRCLLWFEPVRFLKGSCLARLLPN